MSFENYKNNLVVVKSNKAIVHNDQKKILMDHSGISMVYKENGFNDIETKNTMCHLNNKQPFLNV